MTSTRVAAGLCAAAIFSAALWGGMLGDRAFTTLGPDNPMQLVGLPLAGLLFGIGLPIAAWRAEGRSPTVRAVCAAALLIWSAVSLTVTHDLSAGWSMLQTVGSAVAAAGAVSILARDPLNRWGIAIALVTAGAVVSAMGLSEYISHAKTGDTSWRVFSTFSMPNFLAGYLVLQAPMAVALFLGARDRAVVLLAGMALLLDCACLLLTGSRFGLIGLVVAFGLFFALSLWMGILAGPVRKRALALVALGALAILVGARPVISRLRGTAGESYSGKFRVLTWSGAFKMAARNPLLGTGIGSFATAYPPYAAVGFTEHAHNSYLQLAAETGFPSLVFLGVTVIGVFAGGIRWLSRNRHQAMSPDDAVAIETLTRTSNKSKRSKPPGKSPPTAQSAGPNLDLRVLMVGAISCLAGALVRNVFDSDLFVGTNAVTFAAVCGLVVGATSIHQSEVRGPKTRQIQPAWLTRSLAVALAAFLAVQGLRESLARTHAYAAQAAVQAGNLSDAEREYRDAVAVDGANPDYHLSLAQILVRNGDLTGAEREYSLAVASAPIWKPFNRFGRFYIAAGRPNDAAKMFEKARRSDPNNVQNLLALAEAYRAAHDVKSALAAYRSIVALENSPIGKLRALPERIPWEFAACHFALAEEALIRSDTATAERELREGLKTSDEFWRLRFDARNQVSDDVWKRVTDKYDWALAQIGALLRKRGALSEAAVYDSKRASFMADSPEAEKKRSEMTQR